MKKLCAPGGYEGKIFNRTKPLRKESSVLNKKNPCYPV